MSTLLFVPSTLRGAGSTVRYAFSADLDKLSKPDFVRVWNAVCYAFPGLHPDGYEDAGSGWPRVLKRFAAEAWRRADAGELADEELYPSEASWSGIYDRLEVTTAEENRRRVEFTVSSVLVEDV